MRKRQVGDVAILMGDVDTSILTGRRSRKQVAMRQLGGLGVTSRARRVTKHVDSIGCWLDKLYKLRLSQLVAGFKDLFDKI